MTDKMFLNSSPSKKKKGEPRAVSPRTPQRDHEFGTPGSLLDFSMTPFPMTPFLMVSPGSTKVPSSRDWAVAFDHNNTQSTFSANVFNNHDLTPPLSVFGSRPNNKRKDDDIMSPLLDLNEQDACFDQTSQSLLNSHKQTLFNRLSGNKVTAPAGLVEETSEVRFQLNGEPSSSLIQSVKLEPKSGASLLRQSPECEEPNISNGKVNGNRVLSSSEITTTSGLQPQIFEDTSGLDAIINAAGADLDDSPENVRKYVASSNAVKKSVVASAKSLKSISTPVEILSPPKPIISQDLSPPASIDPLLKLEMQASLIRAQAANKQDDNKIINCNCKKSRCLKMYCDCFRLTEYCKPGCHCIDCNNLEQHETARQVAIKSIVERNPEAFKPRVTEDPKSNSKGHLTGCHCRKSQCLKKYCECFTGHVPCTPRCRCVDCKNGAELYSADDLARHKALLGQDPFSSFKKHDESLFGRNISPSGGTRLFDQRGVNSANLSKRIASEIDIVENVKCDDALQSPSYNSMKSPELTILTSKFGSQFREQPASVRSEQSVNLHNSIEESPERIEVNSLLSPTSESQILNAIKEDVSLSDSKDDGKIPVPSSPLRSMGSTHYVPSPMRLLELASVCEERQEQELTSRSQSQAHSRSGSIS